MLGQHSVDGRQHRVSDPLQVRDRLNEGGAFISYLYVFIVVLEGTLLSFTLLGQRLGRVIFDKVDGALSLL